MLAFSGIDKSRKPNKYWYKACRVITETKGNGGTLQYWDAADVALFLQTSATLAQSSVTFINHRSLFTPQSDRDWARTEYPTFLPNKNQAFSVADHN